MAQHDTPDTTDLPASPAAPIEAKDEMNLAEFPLSLLTDRPDADRAALVYEDTTFDSGLNRTISRKLTITAPAKHGLPRGADEDVIVALIQLTKLRNGFSNRRVRFTRSELIALLGWPFNGKSYDRLTASLKRWTVASLEYDNAWWVKSEQRWTSKVFHILDECEINDSRTARGRSDFLASEISWNETVFNSFSSGNLKDLDYDLYLKLEFSTSKRMFRFLDKRLYRRTAQVFDLRDFAFAHIGLSPGYRSNVGKIKEKLRPAIAELVDVGFLEPMTEDQRYTKDAGTWRVEFRRRESAPLPSSEEVAPPCPLATQLVERGVTPITARELVAEFPAERIAIKLEILDWLVARADRKVSTNPAGYLAKSIRDDFAAPRGFRSRAQIEAERQKVAAAEQARAAQRTQARAADEQQRAVDAVVDAHLAGLSAAERAEVERAAFASTDLDPRLFARAIVREFVATQLAHGVGDGTGSTVAPGTALASPTEGDQTPPRRTDASDVAESVRGHSRRFGAGSSVNARFVTRA